MIVRTGTDPAAVAGRMTNRGVCIATRRLLRRTRMMIGRMRRAGAGPPPSVYPYLFFGRGARGLRPRRGRAICAASRGERVTRAADIVARQLYPENRDVGLVNAR